MQEAQPDPLRVTQLVLQMEYQSCLHAQVALAGWALLVVLGLLTGPAKSPIDASKRK